MTATQCPACDTSIDVPDDVRTSEILDCRDCDAELEVLVADPLTLGIAPDVEEDWGE